MSVESAVSETIRLIFSAEAIDRERGADEVTDILESLGPWEVELLSRSLTTAYLAESHVTAQEAQLHALSELSSRHGLSPDVRERLLDLDRRDILNAHREYVNEIREDGC
jgi:hypothetical protein